MLSAGIARVYRPVRNGRPDFRCHTFDGSTENNQVCSIKNARDGRRRFVDQSGGKSGINPGPVTTDADDRASNLPTLECSSQRPANHPNTDDHDGLFKRRRKRKFVHCDRIVTMKKGKLNSHGIAI
jgi:hypothetical protein